MARVATLWPGGIRPWTVIPSLSIRVPPTSCWRAMTTSSCGWMRMTRPPWVAVGFSRSFIAASSSVVDQLRIPGVDLLLLLAEAGDAELHLVARLQVHRGRLHAERHAGRRAGGDEIAGPEGAEAAAVGDQLGDAEDHGRGAAVLHPLAVDLEPHRQRLRIGDLVCGDHPRADRAEGVAALALVPG